MKYRLGQTRSAIRCAFALLVICLCGAIHAQVPLVLNYQGLLTTAANAPVNGAQVMTFRLYNVASGGAALYTETQPSVAVTNGIFNAVIGTVTPLNLPFNVPYWLSVAINADAEMSPRQQVTASAYSLRSANADALAATATVGGSQVTGAITVGTLPTANLTGTISTAQIANNAVTQAKLSPVSGAAPGKVLGTDGSNLQWQSDASSGGTVTSVGTGPGLTGGAITSAGTINLAGTQLLPTVACATNQIAKWNGSAWACAADNAGPANAFVQDGNAFGATAVLGTTDAQPFEVQVQGSRVMRYEPNATSPNIIGGHFGNFANGIFFGQTISGGGRAGNNCREPPTGTFTRTCANQTNSLYATVVGGLSNQALSSGAFVGGGESNTAYGSYDVVGGGSGNTARGNYSTVGGGLFNVASGYGSVVAGGHLNEAGGIYSAAAGHRAKVRNATQSGDFDGDEGSFVWADSNFADFFSTGPNEFAVRATGGVRFVTAIDGSGNPTRTVRINPNGEADFGSQTRQMLNLWGPAEYGIGIQSGTLYFRTNPNFSATTGGFSWFNGGSHNDSANNPGGGVEVMRLASNGTLYVTNGTVGILSDRAAKQDFAAVDTALVLDKVAQLPLSSWVYKANPGVRHLGPTAQDFHAAFTLGDVDGRTIATVDVDGVALAAIQGLNAKLELELSSERAARLAQARELETQRAELSELRRTMEILLSRTAPEARLAVNR